MNYQLLLVIWLAIGFIHSIVMDGIKASKQPTFGEFIGYMLGCLIFHCIKYGVIVICLINGGFFSK